MITIKIYHNYLQQLLKTCLLSRFLYVSKATLINANIFFALSASGGFSNGLCEKGII